ncbi:MAG: hypothetical protein GXY76_04015, partial [Chloroflexi bacterium]|nr:hypothetical protein [Chloroflexota bacterium]
NRERAMAVLHYQPYDRLPVVHFGFWRETLTKWAAEGHITAEQSASWGDGNPTDQEITRLMGFDFNWYSCFHPHTGLRPGIQGKVLEVLPDGGRVILNGDGAIVLQKDDATGIPSEIDHLLKDRASWEAEFAHRLQFTPERVTRAVVNCGGVEKRYDEGGLDWLQANQRETPYGLHCGSLYGVIRGWLGLLGSSYLLVDDEPLLDEIIDTVGELCYQATKRSLEDGAKYDFAHFWEDICFKNGPLINPAVFRAKVGPHYKRITELVGQYGLDIVSLDCDGKIDALVPIWFENGVNTMFPIEVGVWDASIAPWRKLYGRGLRGVGGTDKKVFARDRAAIDAEVERLRPLVELGGYIPCPDHRLPPDAEWANVLYYCERMHAAFG